MALVKCLKSVVWEFHWSSEPLISVSGSAVVPVALEDRSISLNSQFYLLNSRSPPASTSVFHSCTTAWIFSQGSNLGNWRLYFLCFSLFRDYWPFCLVSGVLKIIVQYILPIFLYCFRWIGKFSLCYSIVAGNSSLKSGFLPSHKKFKDQLFPGC